MLFDGVSSSRSDPAVAEGAKRRYARSLDPLSSNCTFLLQHPHLLRVGKEACSVWFTRAVAKIATALILPLEGSECSYASDCEIRARDTVISQFEDESH